MNRFRTIAVTAIAGFVLVACGPTASQSGAESASAQPSQAASVAAQPSAGGVLPSFTTGAAPDLEALIPDTVGSLTITKISWQGNEFLLAPSITPALIKFIQDLGVSPSDISAALGVGSSSDGTVSMFVIRAVGADSSRLVTAFKTAQSPLPWSTSTVGGKQVEVADLGGASTYLYTKGDVLVWVTANYPAAAEDVLSRLP